MPNDPMSWDFCVCGRDQSGYCDLKNAMLYGDHVNWVFPGSILSRDSRAECEAAESVVTEIRSSGGSDIIRPFSRKIDLANPDVSSETRAFVEEHLPAFEGVKCIIGFDRRTPPGNFDDERKSSDWTSYGAVGHLQWALSKVLLADVSSLPFSAILEIRQRTQDLLNPLRGEMLRLTEDLRRITKDNPSNIAAEAENLITTRVEPIAREADYRTRQLADQKWRKLYTSAAKAFGFAGASLIDPKLIAKAVGQVAEVGALALQTPEDKTPGPKLSAEFVLRAHIFLRNKSL
jgi:hypothetical protein